MTDRFDDERRLVVQAVAPATPAGLLEPRRPVACFWSVPRLEVLGQRSAAVAEFEPAVFGLGDGVDRTVPLVTAVHSCSRPVLLVRSVHSAIGTRSCW